MQSTNRLVASSLSYQPFTSRHYHKTFFFHFLRFQKRLIEVQGEEDQLLSQWEEKKKTVDEELCLIEEQVNQFAELPDDDLLLEQAIDDNEVRKFCF